MTKYRQKITFIVYLLLATLMPILQAAQTNQNSTKVGKQMPLQPITISQHPIDDVSNTKVEDISLSHQKENDYSNMTEFYDTIMDAGYYDHEQNAHILLQLLEDKRDVLEIGCGTGLVLEKLYKFDRFNRHRFSGMDFTESMIEKARKRLKGYDLDLYQQDFAKMNIDCDFDAIFSQGGPICASYDDGEYVLYSYLTKYDTLVKAIANLHDHMNRHGILLISVQGAHKNYKMRLKNGITYTQKVKKSDNFMIKDYFFKKEGKVLSHQYIRLRAIRSLKEINLLMLRCGFGYLDIMPDDANEGDSRYLLYMKISKSKKSML